MKVQKVQPDPLLTQEEQQQSNADMLTIQKETTANTDTLARLYGTSVAMSGGSMKAPLLGQ
jgi:hypothetical protein